MPNEPDEGGEVIDLIKLLEGGSPAGGRMAQLLALALASDKSIAGINLTQRALKPREQLMTILDVAHRLNMTEHQARKERRKPGFPEPVRFGRVMRFVPDEIEAYIESRRERRDDVG